MIIEPIWNLSGKIANWLVSRAKTLKQTSFKPNRAIISILSTALIVGMSIFSVFAPATKMVAFDGSDLAKAQRFQNIQVKSQNKATYNYIAPVNVNLNAMVLSYKLDSDYKGTAVVDSNLQDVPFMPTPNGLYVFVNSIGQNTTKNYRFYSANEDLHGDRVIMPSSAGLNVAGSSDFNFGTNDFEIKIDGLFNPYNMDKQAQVIFQNNQFALVYYDKQLKLVLSTSASESQIHTIQPSTYLNGQKSVVIPKTSATGNITIAYAPLNTTSIATNNGNTITGTTSTYSSSASSNLVVSTTIRNYPDIGNTWYTDSSLYVDIIHYITRTDTITRSNTYYIYNGTQLPLTINGTGYNITANTTGTTNFTIDNNNPITIKANSNNSTTITSSTGNNGAVSSVVSYVPKSTQWGAGWGNTWTGYAEKTVHTGTINVKQEIANVNTTYYINDNALIGVDANGKIAYGYQYYWIDENSINCNWNGGDKRLTIKRVGDTISVLDGATTLMSANIGNDAIPTNSVNNWTIAQQGAMRFLREMTIKNNGTEVANWEFNTGNTIYDLSNHSHDATYVQYNGELTETYYQVTISGEQPITTTEPTSEPTTSTPTTTASGTTIPITTTTNTASGFLDIDIPDLPQDVDESKWERIFLFGAFYDLAQEGGIPPSLFFVPLMAILTIIAFMVTYHFTRDMLVSGIVGNAMLGVSITLSVFYTIPLIIGLILMCVLLVKRKTISL